MGSITRRLRSLLGRGDDDTRDGDDTREARTKEEDRAIESVETDMIRSRDEAFSRMAGMPGSGDDQRR
jgi:hypothetical protein